MHNGSGWWVGFAITAWLWAGSAGATNAVVTSCTDSGFSNALTTVDGSGGGTVTFNCGTATIVFANSKTIANAVTIDGGGTITLDGNNAVSLIQVFASGNATLKNLSFAEGGNSVGSSRVDLQACKLEYSIVSPK